MAYNYAEGAESVQPKRTTVITVLCIIGLTGAVAGVPAIFSEGVKAVGEWYQVFLGWAFAASLVCVIGMWKMRRWGVYLYILFAAANQLVMLYAGGWRPVQLIVPAVYSAIALTQVRRMA